MPASKIVNEDEAIRWIREGRTYQWIVSEYRRKYGIETTPSMWGNFRRRRGLEPRLVRDYDLIPWRVQRPEHRIGYHVAMLRLEARRRAGERLRGADQKKLESWKRTLRELDAVVHYDPDTEEGWFLVPREPGDKDLIREPPAELRRRRPREE